MGGNVIDTTQLYVSSPRLNARKRLREQASIDPGFDGIFLPNRIAEQLFNGVQGVRRDTVDPRRWVNYIPLASPENFTDGPDYSMQLHSVHVHLCSQCHIQPEPDATGGTPRYAGERMLQPGPSVDERERGGRAGRDQAGNELHECFVSVCPCLNPGIIR